MEGSRNLHLRVPANIPPKGTETSLTASPCGATTGGKGVCTIHWRPLKVQTYGPQQERRHLFEPCVVCVVCGVWCVVCGVWCVVCGACGACGVCGVCGVWCRHQTL